MIPTCIVYIGKESNRLEDVQAGIVHGVDEVLTEYPDPRHDPWRYLALGLAQLIKASSGTQLIQAGVYDGLVEIGERSAQVDGAVAPSE